MRNIQHERKVNHINVGTRRQCLRLFLVLISVVLTSACSGCNDLKPEMNFTDMTATTSAMLSASMLTDTLGQCYHRCVADLSCMSFFYNRITRTCQLHTIIYLATDKMLVEVGSNYYIISCDTCNRDAGYMLSRKLGVCFALIPFSPPSTLDVIRSHCRGADGGRMMTVNTDEKHMMILETVNNSFIKKWSIAIGLTRSAVGDPWRWEDSQPFLWSKWQGTNPTNGITDLCVFMNPARSWNWNDSPCSVSQNKLAACEL